MRGIVYTGEGVEVTDELEVRAPGPNEVRLRIQAAGVCHSDLSVINGTIPFPAPAVLGHEGAGVVESVGDAVRSVKPGDTAAVFGVGGVGLNVIQGLRISGATRIVAVDTVAAKEDLGRQFGATHFVDASAGDAAAAVRELVPADRESAAGALFPLGGVTWAFDCVGHPAVLRSALDCLDWGGNAVAIGIPPRGTEVAVDVNALAYVDRGLLGCRYGSARPHHDIPLMVDLYRTGQLMLDELVSLTRPLDRFGEVIDEMHAGRVARGVLLFD